MHLVFLNQYYPPDAAPTGVMLEGLVHCLLDSGHEVTILCAAGGYAGPQASCLRTEDLGLSIEEETRKGNAPASPAAISAPQSPLPQLRIVRIGATRFGRGTFVGKLLDYASYFVGVAWTLMVLRPRPERIVAMTTPPYLSVLARAISKCRGADHAHWVMDLYPDVMAAHGMLAERSLLYRMLAGLTRWGLGGKRCAALLTLGPDMAERLGDRGGRMAQWVPLWGVGDGCVVVGGALSEVLDCEGEPRPAAQASQTTHNGQLTSLALDPALALRRQRGWTDDEMVVMYSGNMGLGHRFGEILAAAKDLLGKGTVNDPVSGTGGGGAGPERRSQAPRTAEPALRLVFFGDGKRRREVEEFVGENPECGVELHDYAPAEGLAAHLQSADVHLASLDPAWTGTMVPSKVQGIFAAGRPVIFIGSATSSIARWVNASGGGWVLAPGDIAGLLDALAEARDPAVRATRGQAAKAFAGKHFDPRANVAKVAEILTLNR